MPQPKENKRRTLQKETSHSISNSQHDHVDQSYDADVIAMPHDTPGNNQDAVPSDHSQSDRNHSRSHIHSQHSQSADEDHDDDAAEQQHTAPSDVEEDPVPNELDDPNDVDIALPTTPSPQRPVADPSPSSTETPTASDGAIALPATSTTTEPATEDTLPSTTEIMANRSESEESKNQIESDDKPSFGAIESGNDEQKQQPLFELTPRHGHCSKQGMRSSMEDEVVVQPEYTVIGSKCTSGHLSLYGVFDGHGGEQCAVFCAQNLLSILSKFLRSCDDVATAFTATMAELDQRAIKHSADASGSTACIVLIDRMRHDLWCCNVGDSRCILMNSAYSKVAQLSVEHKPDFPVERQRIENANGWVTYGRVCGILAVSRSLGDRDFKYEIEDLIICTPDVTRHRVTLGEDALIVLACDGLYDVFSNRQCMEWVQRNSGDGLEQPTAQRLADKLCDDAIFVRKSKDNVSVLIIRLDHRQMDGGTVGGDNECSGTPPPPPPPQCTTTEIETAESDDDDAEGDDIEPIDDSLSSGQSQNGGNEHILNADSPKKHKFHVVMVDDDPMDVDPIDVDGDDGDDIVGDIVGSAVLH